MAEKKIGDFEKKLKELEKTVAELEGGDADLDEMLALFEKGIKLTRECSDKLNAAEQKITMLVKEAGGEMVEEPFEAE